MIVALDVFGLLAIGFVAAKIAAAVDKKTAQNVVIWGCVIATIRVVYGDMLVYLHLIAPTGAG